MAKRLLLWQNAGKRSLRVLPSRGGIVALQSRDRCGAAACGATGWRRRYRQHGSADACLLQIHPAFTRLQFGCPRPDARLRIEAAVFIVDQQHAQAVGAQQEAAIAALGLEARASEDRPTAVAPLDAPQIGVE